MLARGAFRQLLLRPTAFCSSHLASPLAGVRRFCAGGASSVLVVAECEAGSLSSAALHAISAAQQFSSPVHVLVAGHNCQQAAEQAAKINGVAKVHLSDKPEYDHGLPEQLAPLVMSCQAALNCSHVVATSNAFGRNLMPRLAAKMDMAVITDVVSIQSADTFVRPTYAGNAMSTVQSSDSTKLVTVRSTSFEAATVGDQKAEIVQAPEAELSTVGTKWVQDLLKKSDRPDLTSARVVISGGRGMKSGENFALLEHLADKLNAAVGASRAAVDAGFVSNDMQVGQTGKVVAPELYIAVGISGAIQHLAGMKDSKTIVAINKDPEAPIFHVADYGLVADLFDAVPELTASL